MSYSLLSHVLVVSGPFRARPTMEEPGTPEHEDYGEDDQVLESILQQVVPVPAPRAAASTPSAQRPMPSEAAPTPPAPAPARSTPLTAAPTRPSPGPASSTASSMSSASGGAGTGAGAASVGIDTLVRAGRPIRYFIMKCVAQDNLDIAMREHVWATQSHHEHRLNEAYDQGEVVLVFSVNLSRHFQAYARMASRVGGKADVWTAQQNILGGLFRLQWLKVHSLPFRATEHLTNPWNENKPVKVARDCQELPPDLGYQLCSLIDQVR